MELSMAIIGARLLAATLIVDGNDLAKSCIQRSFTPKPYAPNSAKNGNFTFSAIFMDTAAKRISSCTAATFMVNQKKLACSHLSYLRFAHFLFTKIPGLETKSRRKQQQEWLFSTNLNAIQFIQ